MQCGGALRGWSDHPISSMSHAKQANNTLKMTIPNEYNAKAVKLCRAVHSLAGVLLRPQRAAQPKQRKTTATIKDATA